MKKFAFGRNWDKYVKRMSQEDYFGAKASLTELIPDLRSRTFLDVGCGSGLFSIAACALGAKKVTGFDVDPECISASKNLLERASQWDSDIDRDRIEFKLESILNEELAVEPYDVVYSWGVLHHTGRMYRSFDAVRNLVARKGRLVIAIYNKHFTSPVWKMIKYTYIKSPNFLKTLLVVLVMMVKLPAVLIITRQNPFKKKRGMRYWTDIVDWVGGYPYEYASVDEVSRFFTDRGFTLTKLTKTKGFTGCNEFVFEKTDDSSQ